jgi:hypothetical protein
MADSPGNLRLCSFDLGDQDRKALTRIRERMGLTSNALAVRVALRDLAKRLSEPETAATIPADQPGQLERVET